MATGAGLQPTLEEAKRMHGRAYCFNTSIMCFGVNRGGREMELPRTCCFEFDRMLREGDKQLFLRTFCFYFMLAWFTPLSPLPEVDKT